MIISNQLEDSDIWADTYVIGVVTGESAQMQSTRSIQELMLSIVDLFTAFLMFLMFL